VPDIISSLRDQGQAQWFVPVILVLRRWRSGGLWFVDSLCKQFARLHLKTQGECGGSHCNPSYMGGIGRRIMVRGWPEQNVRPYLKNN
jgi:hypothetical protein